MKNIYAKTVHKEYKTTNELRQITSARGVEGALKAQPTGSGAPLRTL